MKTLYRNGIAAKCDDRQVATLIAAGWSYENATKEILTTTVAKEPVKQVVQPQTRSQQRVQVKPTATVVNNVKKDA